MRAERPKECQDVIFKWVSAQPLSETQLIASRDLTGFASKTLGTIAGGWEIGIISLCKQYTRPQFRLGGELGGVLKVGDSMKPRLS